MLGPRDSAFVCFAFLIVTLRVSPVTRYLNGQYIQGRSRDPVYQWTAIYRVDLATISTLRHSSRPPCVPSIAHTWSIPLTRSIFNCRSVKVSDRPVEAFVARMAI